MGRRKNPENKARELEAMRKRNARRYQEKRLGEYWHRKRKRYDQRRCRARKRAAAAAQAEYERLCAIREADPELGAIMRWTRLRREAWMRGEVYTTIGDWPPPKGEPEPASGQMSTRPPEPEVEVFRPPPGLGARYKRERQAGTTKLSWPRYLAAWIEAHPEGTP